VFGIGIMGALRWLMQKLVARRISEVFWYNNNCCNMVDAATSVGRGLSLKCLIQEELLQYGTDTRNL
jgi:hypothetical protein